MNENNKTFEVVTPIQERKVVIKKWITGAESDQITDPFIETAELDPTTGKSSKMKGTASKKSREASIRVYVVSVDGKEDDIVNRVQNMREEDRNFVLGKINELRVSGKKKSEKTLD